MSAVKKTVTAVISLAVVGALGFAGMKWWKKEIGPSAEGTVYVTKVSELNTVSAFSLSGSRLSGVVEAQKTEEYSFDSEKKIKSIDVKDGDEVKAGDVLFTYDVEDMKMKLEEGKLEIERTENEIETMKLQLEDLEKKLKTANADAQTSLNTQILTLQSDIAKSEYDIKAQKRTNDSMKKSIKNAQVTAKTDGTVKDVADLDLLEHPEMLESRVVLSVTKGGNYRVKGTVNEQLIGTIYESMPVIVRSRVDEDATWSGVITSIETTPQSDNDNMFYDESAGNRTSKYSFYIEPETLDGLLLGQHILIEPDFGQLEDYIVKEGIWLYSDFVFEEDGKCYVWADNGKGRIEKREVTVGQTDEMAGDCEILSGLDDNDSIAYPSREIVPGMTATDNADEVDIPEEDYGDFGMGGDIYGEDFFYDDEFMEDEYFPEDMMDGEDIGGFDGGELGEGFPAEDEEPADIDGDEPIEE